MILSSEEIKRRMHETSVPPRERIVIVPILDPDRQLRPGNGSVDVRLGQRFWIPRRTKLEKLDHLNEDHLSRVSLYKEEHVVLVGDYFVLHPRQFVLGETLEWIHIPYNLAAYVIGRSSWGRDGLIIATATGVHPNFSGILALEITNLGEIPVFLYPGSTIAQLFIHTLKGGVEGARSQSGNRGQTRPRSSDAIGADRAIIRRIGKERGFERKD